MGVNKVIYSGNTILDLTNDSVTETSLLAGVTAHDASGNRIVGTVTLDQPGINILHNADWGYSLVNQLGHSGSVSDKYCIDRWIGNGSVTPVAGSYVTLTAGTTMVQRMEIIPTALVDRLCTFTIDDCNTEYAVTFRFPSSVSAAANIVDIPSGTVELGFISGTFELCGVTCNAVPYMKFTASNNINVRRVFLEFGERSHMFYVPPQDPMINTAICYRYQLIIEGWIPIVGVLTGDKKNMLMPVSTPTPMRIKPSMSKFSISGIRTTTGSNVTPNVTSSYVDAFTPQAVNVMAVSTTFTGSSYTNNTPIFGYVRSVSFNANL